MPRSRAGATSHRRATHASSRRCAAPPKRRPRPRLPRWPSRRPRRLPGPRSNTIPTGGRRWTRWWDCTARSGCARRNGRGGRRRNGRAGRRPRIAAAPRRGIGGTDRRGAGRRHRDDRDAAADASRHRRSALGGPARANRQAGALVRPPRTTGTVAAARHRQPRRVRRVRGVHAARRPQWSGHRVADRDLPQARRRRRRLAAGGVHRVAAWRGSATRRGARPAVRGTRHADRPHRAQDAAGDDRRHAPARRRRSRGIPAVADRPLRVGAGRHGRGAVHAAERHRRGLHRGQPPRGRDAPAWCSCSTFRASPIPRAPSTR